MLKLTKKADYGLIAMRHLAVDAAGTSSAKEIADYYGLPPQLLAKILQKLVKAGLLKSLAGSSGGYQLARRASEINALEVVRAIDGPVLLTSCFTTHGECGQSGTCTVREPLRKVHEGILNLLQEISISDLTRDDSGRHSRPHLLPSQPLTAIQVL